MSFCFLLLKNNYFENFLYLFLSLLVYIYYPCFLITYPIHVPFTCGYLMWRGSNLFVYLNIACCLSYDCKASLHLCLWVLRSDFKAGSTLYP